MMSRFVAVVICFLVLFVVVSHAVYAVGECGDSVFETTLPSGQTQLRMVIASTEAVVDPMGLRVKADFELDGVLDISQAVLKAIPSFGPCLAKVGAFVIVARNFRMGAGGRLLTGGKDLFIYADEIAAHPSATIDLSPSALALPSVPAKAAAGTASTLHGAEGLAGALGVSGGNLTVMAGKKLFSFPSVKSTGGKGGTGGEGGTGVNSTPGKTPANAFPYPAWGSFDVRNRVKVRVSAAVYDQRTRTTFSHIKRLPPVGQQANYAENSNYAVYNAGVINDSSINGGNATAAGNGGKSGTGGRGGNGGNVSISVGGVVPVDLEALTSRIEGNVNLSSGVAGGNGSTGTPGLGAAGAPGAKSLSATNPADPPIRPTHSGLWIYPPIYAVGTKGKDAPPGKATTNTATAAPGTAGALSIQPITVETGSPYGTDNTPHPVLRHYLHMANSLFRTHQKQKEKEALALYDEVVEREPTLFLGLESILKTRIEDLELRRGPVGANDMAEMANLEDQYKGKASVLVEAVYRRGLLAQGYTYFGVNKEFVPVHGYEELLASFETELRNLADLEGERVILLKKLAESSEQTTLLEEDKGFKLLFNITARDRELEMAESNVKRAQQVIERLYLQLNNMLKTIERKEEYLDGVRGLVAINVEAGQVAKVAGVISTTGSSASVGANIAGPVGGIVGGFVGFLGGIAGQSDRDRLAALQRQRDQQESGLRGLAVEHQIEGIHDAIMEQWALLEDASLQLHNSLNERMLAYQRREAARVELEVISQRGLRAISGLGAGTLYDKYLTLYYDRLSEMAYGLLKALEYKWKVRLPDFENQFTLNLNKWEGFDRLRGLVEDKDRELKTTRGRLDLNPYDLESPGYERGKLEVVLSETSLPQSFSLLLGPDRTGYAFVDFEKQNELGEEAENALVVIPRYRKGAEILSLDVWFKPKPLSETEDLEVDCTVATHSFYVEASDREYFADYFTDNVISFNTLSLHAGRDLEGRSSLALAEIPGGSYEAPSMDFIYNYLFGKGRPLYFSRQSPARKWKIMLVKDDPFAVCLKEVKFIILYRYLSNRYTGG